LVQRHARSRFFAVLALSTTALLASAAGAQTTDHLRRELEGVGVDEKLGGAVPLDHEFLDESGRTVSLRKWAGRPILLSLNYTNCPMLCSLQLAGVAKVLKDLGDRAGSPTSEARWGGGPGSPTSEARWGGGRRFEIVTVSIDPAERFPQLARFQRRYVGQAGGSRELSARWHFLAGSEERIRALAGAVGFRYRYDPEAKEFRHQATLIVIGADGRVSSYLHGILYEPDALVAALERAARSEVIDADAQATLGGFLLNCFAFDPEDHTPLALRIMRSGGVLAVLFLAGFMGRHFVREHRARNK
jgi:protein SCO1/2